MPAAPRDAAGGRRRIDEPAGHWHVRESDQLHRAVQCSFQGFDRDLAGVVVRDHL